jgi:CheY-like chemotaxis protein
MKPVVLLADNDIAVSSLLAEILSRGGFEVRQVFDGQSALDALAQTPPDLLVCDLDMPRKSGLHALEELARGGASRAAPPTLVITGYVDSAIERRLAALPFVREVLKKPFDLAGFLARLKLLAALAVSVGPPADDSAGPTAGAPAAEPAAQPAAVAGCTEASA